MVCCGGLANLGATCYINACIVSLAFCGIFREMVLNGDYKLNDELMGELQDVYKKIWVEKHGVIPRGLIKTLKSKISEIDIHMQNDIGEFFVLFIDKLNNSICSHAAPPFGGKSYSRTRFGVMSKKMDDEWARMHKNAYSEIIPLFYGQTINQIKCHKCSKLIQSMDVISTLMVPVPEKKCTLEECLSLYLDDERVETTCEKCNVKGNNTRSWMIWRYPKILVICLKRFTYDLRKNNVYVEVPEDLEMGNHKYTLRSVANHMGSYMGGHYMAYCKHGDDNKWYEYDDDVVRELGTNMPLMQHAYMLFYEKAANS
jgi:ubiquitin C-terminal hydrolase